MQTKQKEYFDTNAENQTNQSCPAIIEEDITRSINQQQDLRIIRSQQFKPSPFDDGKSPTPPKQTHRNQPPPPDLQKHHEKSHSEQKIQLKTITMKKGTDFNCEIVQSIEMSCEQESYRSASIKSKSKNKGQNNETEEIEGRVMRKSKRDKDKQNSPMRKPYFQKKMQELKEDVLNVLVAGAQDTGKTMFIRCFKKKQRRAEQPFIKKRTRQIKYDLGMMDQNLVNRRNTVHFIDLAGFVEQQRDKYLREIKQFAQTQWENYRLRPDDDRRIHCCLYFIRGPRIKQSDLIVMRQLSLWFNLVPVIAKSDQYIKQEIYELKEEFRRRAQQMGIQIFDLEEFYRIKLGTQKLNQFMESSFGRFPPFVIASSFQKQSPESNDFVRKYPWGKVQVENKEHTDFEKLCQVLTGDLRTQLLSRLVDLGNVQEQRVELVEGVIVGQQAIQEKTSGGWKTKLVLGSVVAVLVYAFFARKDHSGFPFKQ